jgi:hypothetical protein
VHRYRRNFPAGTDSVNCGPFGLDATEVLDNVLHARAFPHEQQMQLILTAAAQMSEDQYRL